MLAQRTVIIVGAGASVEAGLPTGEGLIPKITDYLGNTQGDIREYLRYAPIQPEAGGDRRRNMAMMDAAAKRIVKGIHSSFSIDNFIDENKDDKFVETVGKLAIAKTILDAEHASRMMVEPGNIYNEPHLANLRGTWYTKLSSLIFEGCDAQSLPQRLSRLTFIIFNYDRCVEHFLFWAIRLTYGLTNQEAAEVMKHVTIYHPYGKVGSLPWQGEKTPVHFGNPGEWSVDIWPVAATLKTFTEGVESTEHEAIQQAVFEANMVIFLGFAFHNLNMFLLMDRRKPTQAFAEQKRYFGTVYKRSKSDIEILEHRVKKLCSVRGVTSADLADCKCAELFDEYHATFTLERY
jgi:hypothetical protein